MTLNYPGVDSQLDLKVNQVAAWRLERVGDASLAVVDTRLMPHIQQVSSSQTNPAAERRVLAWMDAMRANYQYANIVVADSQREDSVDQRPTPGNLRLL